MESPPWAADFFAVVADVRSLVDTATVTGLASNKVLAVAKPGLG
jgi:hypothetical protein